LSTHLENRDYSRGDPLRWPHDTLCQLNLALTSPTGCGRSVGIVRLRTKTTESVSSYIHIHVSTHVVVQMQRYS
jgi:hypothetical protein